MIYAALDRSDCGYEAENYGTSYRAHILGIYKSYLLVADKISDRRQAVNSNFLALNSVFIALVSNVDVSTGSTPSGSPFFRLVTLSRMVLDFLWYRLIRSYKDVNTGKFKVVHAIEKLLPLHAFDAEWAALGRGENSNLYLPFTHIEIYLPGVFFIIHLFVLIKSFM